MVDTGIKEIIESIKRGDNEAVGKLYEQYRVEGLSVARKYVKNRDDAEDMYQDAFLKAITNIDSFDETRDFGPWFKTIIANTCKNFLVKKKAVNFSEMSDEENEFVDTLGSTDDDTVPELTYDRKEFIKIMDGIINELPQAQREAVALFYYKEMSIKEIARLQEVPEDTVKSRLNYSRKKVGAAVEEYEKKTGTKLYGAIIIPVMFTLFYRNSVYAAEADMLLADVMGDAASAPVASSSGPEAGSATHRIATQRVKNVSSLGAKKVGAVGAKSVAADSVGKTVAMIVIKIVIPVISATVIGVTAYKVVEDKKDIIQTESAGSNEGYDEERKNDQMGNEVHDDLDDANMSFEEEQSGSSVDSLTETKETEPIGGPIESLVWELERTDYYFHTLSGGEYSYAGIDVYGRLIDIREKDDKTYTLLFDHVRLCTEKSEDFSTGNIPDEVENLYAKYDLPSLKTWKDAEGLVTTVYTNLGDKVYEFTATKDGFMQYYLEAGPDVDVDVVTEIPLREIYETGFEEFPFLTSEVYFKFIPSLTWPIQIFEEFYPSHYAFFQEEE